MEDQASIKSKYSTTRLFKEIGSVVLGMGSVLNIGGRYFEYNYSKTSKSADVEALKNDWGVIGEDLSWAIEKEKEDLEELDVEA